MLSSAIASSSSLVVEPWVPLAAAPSDPDDSRDDRRRSDKERRSISGDALLSPDPPVPPSPRIRSKRGREAAG
jgi:hypothetical protein